MSNKLITPTGPRTCGNCLYYRTISGKDRAVHACMLKPPVPFAFLMVENVRIEGLGPQQRHSFVTTSCYPTPSAGDWCGEYKPAAQTEH